MWAVPSSYLGHGAEAGEWTPSLLPSTTLDGGGPCCFLGIPPTHQEARTELTTRIGIDDHLRNRRGGGLKVPPTVHGLNAMITSIFSSPPLVGHTRRADQTRRDQKRKEKSNLARMRMAAQMMDPRYHCMHSLCAWPPLITRLARSCI
jgi:hypothetical protein